MKSKEGALQGTGRTGRRGREHLSVKDALLALGGGPHHYPHYPNWAQQCLVTFIIIDHAYANERVCAHELSVGWFRCRGNIETKYDNFCDAKKETDIIGGSCVMSLSCPQTPPEWEEGQSFLLPLPPQEVCAQFWKITPLWCQKRQRYLSQVGDNSPGWVCVFGPWTHPHICLVFIALWSGTRCCKAPARAGSCSLALSQESPRQRAEHSDFWTTTQVSG